MLQQFTDDLVAIRSKMTLILSDLDMDLLEEAWEDNVASKFVKVWLEISSSS